MFLINCIETFLGYSEYGSSRLSNKLKSSAKSIESPVSDKLPQPNFTPNHSSIPSTASTKTAQIALTPNKTKGEPILTSRTSKNQKESENLPANEDTSKDRFSKETNVKTSKIKPNAGLNYPKNNNPRNARNDTKSNNNVELRSINHNLENKLFTKTNFETHEKAEYSEPNSPKKSNYQNNERQFIETSRKEQTNRRVKRIKRTKPSIKKEIDQKSEDELKQEENELENVLKEVEATLISLSPEEKTRLVSPHPKSPNFTHTDIRSPKLSGFRPAEKEKTPAWKVNERLAQSQVIYDRYEPMSSNSHYESEPNSRRLSEAVASEFSNQFSSENSASEDLIKVNITKPSVSVFSKVNQNYNQPQSQNYKTLKYSKKNLSQSLDFSSQEDLNRMVYLRKHYYDNQYDYDSGTSTMNSAPISANDSNWSHRHNDLSSSRSSSIWSKYDDIQDRNVAVYSHVLRKYGDIMELESPRVSHVQKNKMDPARKVLGQKSYALDHAKRVLVRLKQATGQDFELLHEKEIEDELISGVEPPKKLPPLGLVEPIEIEVRLVKVLRIIIPFVF